MASSFRTRALVVAAASIALLVTPASADHSWSTYHWVRTSTQVNLNVGDNVGSAWDNYLREAVGDWNPSSVIQLTVVAGGSRQKNCRPTAGRIEVCADRYGFNGWLGIAQIWISGGHISQGVAKMNDSYFNSSTYNTPAWRRLVMCQEIAHDFGLDHQDEAFNNANLGSCMDYTNDPDGPPSNEHPNAHDFDQLELIYDHLESASTASAVRGAAAGLPMELRDGGNTPGEWGRVIARYPDGRPKAYLRELGGGQRVITHVTWVPGHHRGPDHHQ